MHVPAKQNVKYVRQKLINLKADRWTISVGEFNIPSSAINRSNRQKINKAMVDLNSTINQVALTFADHSTQQGRKHVLVKLTWNTQ